MADTAKRLEKAEKYLQKGKTESALEEYLSILEDEPNNDNVRQTAAELCASLGRAKEATELLGLLFDRQAGIGDGVKANITYKKLLKVGTPTMEQTFRYAQLIEKSNKKDALEAYQTALAGFTASGNKKEALALLKRMVGLNPSAESLKQEGELAAELGENKVAASAFLQVGALETKAGNQGGSWYARAYALDGSNQEAALAHGRTLTEQGKAEAAIQVLEPLATFAESQPQFREAYARALLGAKRTLEAEPFIWELFEKDPKQVDEVANLISALIDVEQSQKALLAARKLEEHQQNAGKRREHINQMKEITDKHPPGTEFLEYMVELFNSTNREQDYCATLIKLFDLYYAAGNFIKAGDSLDRAAEVDPYEEGHKKRLEMLRGKLDGNRFGAISNRIVSAGKEGEARAVPTADAGEPTVLEDFILQAEIFLQYGMRSKAVERLERANKLFPREEDRNEKLRGLYQSAGFMPKYEGAPAPPAAAAASGPGGPPVPAPISTPGMPAFQSTADENAVDNIGKVTEITRNIYRQANVKGVLFAAVNDVGRHWNASRCVAGLCAPGKPPSAALEYCAPGVKQSDVMAIVKLIGALQALAVTQGPVILPQAQAAPELAPVKQFVDALAIQSILAVPLVDGDEHAGILFLEQCGTPREWRQNDIFVLKTIADQMVLAVNNAKLRSLMKTLAVTDEKSGLLKRSSYLQVLLSEVRRAQQQSSASTLMLLHFGKASTTAKEIGEQAIESMMQQIGQVVCSNIRQNDVAVRYQLTTIALVLADTNDKNAFFVVDKMRKVLAGTKFPGTDRAVPITVGIAEAVMKADFDPVDIVTEVINRVESALEAARAEGGNKAQSLAPVLEVASVA
ncbi:MAG TPA: diguanylate cyclase [Terriglobales bacterium]|nr:diguanylate cyclase [Terriglobales bacterium]